MSQHSSASSKRSSSSKRVGAIVQRADMIGIDRQRAVETRQRLFGPLQAEQRQTEIVECIEALRLERQRRRDSLRSASSACRVPNKALPRL